MPNKCQVFVTLDNVHPKVLKTKNPSYRRVLRVVPPVLEPPL